MKNQPKKYSSYHFVLVIVYFSGVLEADGDWQYLFEQGFYHLKKEHPELFEFSDGNILYSWGPYNEKLNYSKAISEIFSDLVFAGMIKFDQFGHYTFSHSFYGEKDKYFLEYFKSELHTKDLTPFMELAKEFRVAILEIQKKFQEGFKEVKLLISERANLETACTSTT